MSHKSNVSPSDDGETRNYISPDGLVEVITKTAAKRFPPHRYLVVCLRFLEAH